MEAAAPGLLEAGAPATVVQSPETLGMSSFPTDILHLPDGRVVIASPMEIVIGDGIRWELHRRSDDGRETTSGRVVADAEGNLYVAVRGGIARIVFLGGGRWTVERLFNLTKESRSTGVFLNSNLRVGRQLLWYGNGGTVVSWAPGENLHEVTRAPVTDLVFAVGEKLFIANWGAEGLFAVEGERLVPITSLGDQPLSTTVNAAVPLDDERTLVATYPGGLRVFNGREMKPFPNARWSESSRISSLIALGERRYAAAVDGEGIVFFDDSGQVLQALDRETDLRFTRVQRIVSSEKGVLWALLNEGVARVHFPSGLTRFDERVKAGLVYSNPVRWKGRLWLQADGKVLRGLYDESGRLVRFGDETPAPGFIFRLSTSGGHLFAGTDRGLYERVGEEWVMVAPDLVNARVEIPPDEEGRHWFVARGAYGWLKPAGPGEWTRRTFVEPDLTDAFSCLGDGSTLWLELGGSNVGRVHRGESPLFERLSGKDGLPEGWAQLFRTADGIRLQNSGQTYRFDEQRRRFLVDTEFMERNPWAVNAIGRPGLDSQGRQWYANVGFTRVVERNESGTFRTVMTFPPGITPYAFVMEEDGVVWMGQRGRLLRFDPRFAPVESGAVRALITRVEFPDQRSPQLTPTGTLGSIPFEENSPTFFFMAPGNPFATPATFEFRLEGGEDRWISTGVAGMAAFHRLYEGRYVLHLRPVVAGQPQAETTLAFEVLPPWYRHPVAYFAYGCLLVVVLAGSGMTLTYLQRREKVRLERLVEERTQAVQQANRQLAQQVSETMAKSSELRLSEERYRALYDNNPAMYFTLDAAGRILSVNLYGAEQLGYRPAELLGRHVALLIHPADHVLLAEASSRCLAQHGRSFSWQLRKLTREGTVLHVKEMARAVRQPDGEVVMFVVCEDISSTVKLEDQLRQAQRMEAVGQLAGGVAHDFNNLLTVIRGQAEWIEMYAQNREESLEGVQQIRAAADQATKLTRQLLVFSRRQAMQVERADLNVVITRVLAMLERAIGEDIKVETRFALEQSPVLIDTGMIEQVLVNLALNARDAMPKGGRITLDVAPCHVSAEKAAGRSGCRPGRYLCITFSDTGAGIAPDVLPRIFEPFYTTKAPGQGTGLGLATTASILSQHQGWIEVESLEGRGTTFRCYLPEGEGTLDPSVPAVPQRAPAAERGSLLLVEDEPAVRLVAKRLLEKFGYRVTEACHADDALATWKAAGGQFDLLLTDILMPGSMNGRELAERLRKERPDLAICLMTGHDPDMLARKDGQPALQAPHLLKPFTRETLLAALQKVRRA